MSYLYLALTFVITLNIAQAEALNLTTALKEVGADSPTLAATTSKVREANWKKKEAWGEFLPHLYIQGDYITDKKYQFININFAGNDSVIPQIISNSQFSLNAELPLFNGFASTNRLFAASDYAQAADRKLDWAKFKTEMDVTTTFYEALASSILKDVSEQNLKALEDHTRLARLFKKNGLSTHYDILRVEVEASNAQTDLADREDDIIIARERLAQILGHDNEDRELTGKLPIPNADVIKRMQKKDAQRADIEALRLEASARRYEETAAKRFWVPQFSLFANYTLYNNLTPGLNDWDSYRNARQVGIMMTWNLFDGLYSYSQAKQSIERKIQAEKALRINELAANKDASVWRRRYLSQCRLYKARKNDVEKSEESVRLAKEGRKQGSRTDTDLLDAEAVLYRSRAAVVKAQLEAVKALANLQLAEGRRYTDFN